jgi:homoserine/homoserine lactone efflux protein
MVEPGVLLAFAAAVSVLIVIPGPNVALIIANSVSYGMRYGLLTVAGTSTAMVVQLSLTAASLTGLLGNFGAWFAWLRWMGVAYLISLGVAQWRARPVDLAGVQPEPGSASPIFIRALLVSLTNPKTLLFYGAFFPQFVRMDSPVGAQVATLSVVFLAVAVAIDSAWAVLAGRVRGLMASRGRLRNRVSGGFLIGAGAALALARNK